MIAQQASRAARRAIADAVIFNDGIGARRARRPRSQRTLGPLAAERKPLWNNDRRRQPACCAAKVRTWSCYEYPFNESIRTMLRLEHLFDRLGQLMPRDAPLDHHFALATIFEIMDVASRADLKSDLLKELERHKAPVPSATAAIQRFRRPRWTRSSPTSTTPSTA